MIWLNAWLPFETPRRSRMGTTLRTSVWEWPCWPSPTTPWWRRCNCQNSPRTSGKPSCWLKNWLWEWCYSYTFSYTSVVGCLLLSAEPSFFKKIFIIKGSTIIIVSWIWMLADDLRKLYEVKVLGWVTSQMSGPHALPLALCPFWKLASVPALFPFVLDLS